MCQRVNSHLGRLGFFAFGWRLVVANPAPFAPTPRPTRGAVVAVDASSSSFVAVVGDPGSSDPACLLRIETCCTRASERDSRGAFFRDALEVRASSTTPEDRDARRARYTPAATPTTAAVVAASHHDVSPRTAGPIRTLHARGELAEMCGWPLRVVQKIGFSTASRHSSCYVPADSPSDLRAALAPGEAPSRPRCCSLSRSGRRSSASRRKSIWRRRGGGET